MGSGSVFTCVDLNTALSCIRILGHKLFKTTSGTYLVEFLAGGAFGRRSSPTRPTSNRIGEHLNRTPGTHFSHSHFPSHIFYEEKRADFATPIALPLDRCHGSIIFGSHVTLPVKLRASRVNPKNTFSHSPESREDMQEERVFKGDLSAYRLHRAFPIVEGNKCYWLLRPGERL